MGILLDGLEHKCKIIRAKFTPPTECFHPHFDLLGWGTVEMDYPAEDCYQTG